MARVVISFVVLSQQQLDDDNLQGALKPLRDAIAAYFSIDDNDGRIRWEYGQSETKGEEGVIVKLEALPWVG